MTIVCGTGHRPNKLGGYSTEASYKVEQVALDWLEEIGGDYRDSLLIISGGALGWDQALASDLVLALWNGTAGGTANCIKYAEKVGKPIVNCWSRYEEAS